MTASIRLVLVIAGVTACAPPPAPTTAPASSSATPSTSTSISTSSASDASSTRPILDIAPATLAWGGAEGPILTLDPAGYLSISSDTTAFLAVPLGRITAGGEFRKMDGSAFITIDDAGTILVDGRDLGFVIEREGTAWQRGEKLHFEISDDGTVSGTNPATGGQWIDRDSRYVGPSATRRAIMLAKLTWAAWLPWDEPTAVAPGMAKPTSIPACDAYRAMSIKLLACAARDSDWTKWLQRAIARVDGYATQLPAWGREATASACELGSTRLNTYFGARKC
jgi:hypothetical protein